MMLEKPIIFNYYTYGTPYFGGYHGMRYAISRTGEKPEFSFQVITWPEPNCLEATNEEDKERKEFPFDEAGYDEVIQWLNHQSKKYCSGNV